MLAEPFEACLPVLRLFREIGVDCYVGGSFDIFVSGKGPLDRAAMRRRQRIGLGDPPEPVDIASAEDSVLRKLLWYRLGNEMSERQLQDVLGVLKTQRVNLDLHYLEAMAKQLEIEDLWRRAKDAAGLDTGFEHSG